MKNKKKGFNPFDETMKLGQLSAGTVIAGGIPSMIGKHLPGSETTTSKINNMAGKTLPLIPMMHGTKTVFGSMGMLQDVERKAKRKRR